MAAKSTSTSPVGLTFMPAIILSIATLFSDRNGASSARRCCDTLGAVETGVLACCVSADDEAAERQAIAAAVASGIRASGVRECRMKIKAPLALLAIESVDCFRLREMAPTGNGADR